MKEPLLRSTCESLLRDKDVRRVIALHVVKTDPTLGTSDHAQILKDLAKWANPVQQRRSA
jgi:hypothetical protein